MLKIFVVKASKVGYDEYASFVVLAESKEVLEKEIEDGLHTRTNRYDLPNDNEFYFLPYQFPITVEEVDRSNKGNRVIHSSFRAG